MRFLAKFLRVFGASHSGETEHSKPTRLARFCYEKKHFSAAKKCVLPGAFMPPPALELSVFVIDGLEVERVHEHGRRYALRKGKPPAAYGAIQAVDVEKQKLTVHRNDHVDGNPPLHADVRGWPNEKSEQKSIAQQLAAVATLHLANETAANSNDRVIPHREQP